MISLVMCWVAFSAVLFTIAHPTRWAQAWLVASLAYAGYVMYLRRLYEEKDE